MHFETILRKARSMVDLGILHRSEGKAISTLVDGQRSMNNGRVNALEYLRAARDAASNCSIRRLLALSLNFLSSFILYSYLCVD